MYTALANVAVFQHLPTFNLMLPVMVGVMAGLGIVGAIHYLIRPRAVRAAKAAPAPQEVHPDPFIHGSPGDNRNSFRRKGNPVEVLVVNQKTKAAPFKGYVFDRSVGGLGLYFDAPIEKESQLTVRPVNAPHMAPWVEVVVKSCRESEGGWEVGCQFVRTPPWALLLMFG
jgi:hypothetical protein